MCGIAGGVFWTAPAAGDPSAVVAAMTDALRHRGPDGQGLATNMALTEAGPAVAFGHTRLAILDLSDRGAQPMRSRSGRCWITFNGEIYNFHALRRQLEERGRRFQSSSDTEVILEAYEEWGDDVVGKLQGMFAFAIWDAAERRLFLARDRVGIKPLYVHRAGGHLLFASEIRSLLASGLVPRRLDRGAVDQYLAYQSVSAPRTLVEGVRMLRPGHVASVGPTGADYEEHEYWNWLDAPPSPRAHGEAVRARVRELVIESVSLHLVSDVPVGIFLSGGIDSSALVGLTRHVGTVPRTFSVVLPGSRHDESRYAREVAAKFDADHTEIPLTERDFRDRLPDAMAHVDHPSADGPNTFVVAEAVRRAGIKVALSGLGGDEVFGGYPSFRRMRAVAGYAPAWQTPASVRAVVASAIRAIGGESVASTKAAALLESDGTLAQAFPVMRQVFSREERANLVADPPAGSSVDADPYVALLQEALRRHPDVGLMTFVSYAEACTYMHDVLLRETDQMTMAHGLEARVPFLDHRLVEYVMSLPDADKEPGAVPKRLLVESLDGLLPADCVQRPKQGFVLPFETWMKGDLREFCEHHLGPNGLGGRGAFDPAALQALWCSFLDGDRRTTWTRPWTLVALDEWIERNGIAV